MFMFRVVVMVQHVAVLQALVTQQWRRATNDSHW